MSNFLRSRENVEIYASLFCSFDYELALRTIASGQLLRPSTSGQLSTSVDESPLALTTKPSRPVSDDQDRLSIFGRLSMSENDVLECATPSAEEVHDAETLLRSHFGDPPFLPRVRALRILVKTSEECPDYDCLSRLLLPLVTEELVLIAEAVSEEIPTPCWSDSQRSTVVAALARVCAALFRAAADACAVPPRTGVGDGYGRSRGGDSADDATARHDAARQVQQLRARHWSRFPATHAAAVTMGIFPEFPVSVVDWDMELLLGFRDALEGEWLAIDLLVKSCHDPSPDSSLATSDAMSIITDPDFVFAGSLRSGEISLAGLHPYERLVSIPPLPRGRPRHAHTAFSGGLKRSAGPGALRGQRTLVPHTQWCIERLWPLLRGAPPTGQV